MLFDFLRIVEYLESESDKDDEFLKRYI